MRNVEMEERKGAELVKFEQEGQAVEGILLQVGPVEIDEKDDSGEVTGKKTVQGYQVGEVDDDMNLTGNEFQFLQLADLRTKIKADDKGKYVRVRFSSTRETNNGTMKVFDVQCSKKVILRATRENSLGITDQDIPF